MSFSFKHFPNSSVGISTRATLFCGADCSENSDQSTGTAPAGCGAAAVFTGFGCGGWFYKIIKINYQNIHYKNKYE